jgi:Ca-activated chloride channel homolog
MKRAPAAVARLMLFVSCFSVLAASTARAESARDAAVRLGRVTEGALFWRTAERDALVPAPVLKTDVHLVVTGIVARATVRQEFSNPGSGWTEGVYVFPLPDDAAVDHLRMQVGDRSIEGVIQERVTAKARYEHAKRAGQRASLVEQERSNIFTTSVANVPPGASIRIEVEYQQAVRYDGGQFRLRFPMVVGPRYVPDSIADAVPDASRITPPVEHPARGSLNPVSLVIDLDAGVPLARVEASYHAIQTTPLAGGRYRIELAQGSVPADRDFELVWQPYAEALPAAVLFTERKDGETFALLMVMPPTALDGLRLPREVIFVIDNSGSMHGASIDQARAAVRLALRRLRPTDSFNVIRFNHTTDALFPRASAATPQNLALADRYAAGLRAEGGTVMLPALRQALDGQEHPGRLRQMIFLTDGAVGNEAQLFAAIHERLGDTRLFTIGIGSAPNSHFMREAARLGRGTFTYIGSTAEVKDKMVALFAKLESPALTDVRLDLAGGAGIETVPERIPDVYLGEPVTVALRAAALPPRVILSGQLGPDQ